jgi:hypothetical protein
MIKVLHKKLNELQATAICGNDISSSCLYVSAPSLCMQGNTHGFHCYSCCFFYLENIRRSSWSNPLLMVEHIMSY